MYCHKSYTIQYYTIVHVDSQTTVTVAWKRLGSTLESASLVASLQNHVCITVLGQGLGWSADYCLADRWHIAYNMFICQGFQGHGLYIRYSNQIPCSPNVCLCCFKLLSDSSNRGMSKQYPLTVFLESPNTAADAAGRGLAGGGGRGRP